MPQKYCEQCDKEVSVEVIEREEEYPVRGTPIKVMAQVAVCSVCHGDLFNEQLDTSNLKAAYDKYASMHRLVSASEVRAMREQYGLSQRGLARLLRLGVITIHRYESGQAPLPAHSDLIRHLAKPEHMLGWLEAKDESDPDVQTVLSCISGLRTPPEGRLIQRLRSLRTRPATIATGYLLFDVEKFGEMVRFFARTALYKIKLCKLLFYADFIHFKRHAVSISGTPYAHLPYGPAPDEWRLRLIVLGESGLGVVSEESHEWEDGAGDAVTAVGEFDSSLFGKTEMDTLQEVERSALTRMSASEVAQYSHGEEAWTQTSLGDLIPYDYASALREPPK